jgi:hypothetical protein
MPLHFPHFHNICTEYNFLKQKNNNKFLKLLTNEQINAQEFLLSFRVSRFKVTLCTTRCNAKKLYFPPTQLVYVFACISEQKAITFLYIVSRLNIITEKKCVYCVVRSKYLNMTVVNCLPLGRTMAHLFSCLSVSFGTVLPSRVN